MSPSILMWRWFFELSPVITRPPCKYFYSFQSHPYITFFDNSFYLRRCLVHLTTCKLLFPVGNLLSVGPPSTSQSSSCLSFQLSAFPIILMLSVRSIYSQYALSFYLLNIFCSIKIDLGKIIIFVIFTTLIWPMFCHSL